MIICKCNLRIKLLLINNNTIKFYKKKIFLVFSAKKKKKKKKKKKWKITISYTVDFEILRQRRIYDIMDE